MRPKCQASTGAGHLSGQAPRTWRHRWRQQRPQVPHRCVERSGQTPEPSSHGGIVRAIEPLDRDELRSQGRQRRPTFSTMGITFTVCSDGRGPRPGVAARRHPSIQSERRERLADHALHGVAPQLDQNCLQTQALHQPVQRRPSGGVPDRRVSVALPGVEARLLLHSTSVVSSESCRRSAELNLYGVKGTGCAGATARPCGRRLRRRPRPGAVRRAGRDLVSRRFGFQLT